MTRRTSAWVYTHAPAGTRWGKRALSLLLSLVLCLTLLPGAALAEEETSHTHCFCGGDVTAGDHTSHTDVTYQEWNGTDSITYDENGKAYVYLTDNAQFARDLNVDNGQTLYLCLNGKEYKCIDYGKINVNPGGCLYLCDCQGTGKIVGNDLISSRFGSGCINITGYYNQTEEPATGYIFGGTITGGVAKQHGGGIFVENNCILSIYGGTITGNRALWYGGGVHVMSYSVVNLYGGTITGNTTDRICGGMFVAADSELNISGAPVVEGNTDGEGACNILLADPSAKQMNFAGEMTEGANLGITVTTLSNKRVYPAVFSSACDTDYSSYFFADSKEIHVEYNRDKQLQLAAGAPSAHEHVWADTWSSNETHHWHNCTADGCDITDDSQKDGYAEHSGEDDGNCTTAVDCKTCNYQIKNGELEHDYPDTWTAVRPGSTHTRKCQNEGCNIAITNSCVSDEKATCQAFAKCTICGGNLGTKADHDFTAETIGEDYLKSAATCTTKAVYYKSCSFCGLSSEGMGNEATFEGEVDAGNHTGELGSSWKHDTANHWKVYSCCGAKAEEAAHVYADDADMECNICRYQRSKPEVKFNSITAVGNGGDASSGNWLNGANWDPADSSNHMTETSPNVYEITYTGVAAYDQYEVKFAADNSWTNNWGAEDDTKLSGNAVHNESGIEFSVDTDKSTVKLVLDLSKYDPDTKTGATYSITITPPAPPAALSPVYVGGEQLRLDTHYINDGTGGVKTSDSEDYNAIVTGSDADGYTLTIKGMRVTGKKNEEQFSYKSSAIYTETGKLTIVVEADSTVTGADTSTHSAGVYAKQALTITGSGTLTANGGAATGTGSGSYGVYCGGTLEIRDAEIKATGGDANESSVGVFGSSVTISGDDTVVTAVGGNGSWRSCGMGGSSSSIRLDGGKVIASGNKNAIITPFATDPQNGKEIRYLVGDEVYTNYNDSNVTNAKSLTVMLGEPAPVYYTVTFITNGGSLTGDGVLADPSESGKYTMQYQKGVGLSELPSPTRNGYTFGGWYDKSDFSTGSGPIGSIGTGAGMNFTFYAKWLKNVAYVETPGDPPRTSYYASLEEAIQAAQAGDTVGLLDNAGTANITRGSFTLDLNGHMLNVLNVSGSADIKLADAGWGEGSIGMISVTSEGSRIRDLCQEGYSLKIGGAWVTDEQLSGSTLSGGIRVYALPITAVTASTDKATLTRGYTESATLTAQAEMSSAPYYSGAVPSYQWYSVTGEGESRRETLIDGAVNADYSFPTGQAAGIYQFVCYASCDGYSVRSNDVTVTVKTNSHSSGSSSTSYSITAEDSRNGSAESSRKSASSGTTVTITVTPNAGYTLETLTVTDKNGRELTLTDKGSGKYTFTMPASKVTVTATFMDDNTMLNYFVDVKTSDYYYDAVLWAAQEGITSGTDAVHFSPDTPCTRAQIVTFLWRAAGSPVVNYAMNMRDVPGDAYYAEAVRWALSEGITTGTTADTFSPNDACTRAQAVTFLFRYAAPAAVTLQELVSGYDDAASVPGYALPAMNWALTAGIVQGDGSNLMPNDPCTRAQIVTFLYRAVEK